MPAKKDYYKILGVAPIATQDEIKKAYRAASKKYHPDLNPDLKLFSEEKMRELVEAYEVLNDVEKRKEYNSQPQFQLRKQRRFSPKTTTYKKTPDKPAYKKETSLLDRLFAPFSKKKETTPSGERFNPKDADMHYTLGLSMAENEAFLDEAINEFKKAIKLDPEYVEALYNLGIVYYKKGLFEEALVSFQKVLSIHKDDAHAKKMVTLLREEF